MTINILQGNPFPPTDIEAVAITNIGLMFGHIFLLVLLMVLLIYFYRKMYDFSYLAVIVIYSFSLLIGVQSFEHIHTPFSPLLEIFFLVFQTCLFLTYALHYNNTFIRKKERRFD